MSYQLVNKYLKSNPYIDFDLETKSDEYILSLHKILLSTKISISKQQNPSQQLIVNSGIYFEKQIYQLLIDNFPNYEIHNIGQSISNNCDIHVIDHINNIKYYIECKNKLKITKMDIDKFENSIINDSHYQNIGIFISIKSNIPIYGKYYIDSKKAYLTSDYINIKIFKLLFSFYPLFNTNDIKIELDNNNLLFLESISGLYSVLKDNITYNNKIIQDNIVNNINLEEINKSLTLRTNIMYTMLTKLGQLNNDDILIKIKNMKKENSKLTKKMLYHVFPEFKYFICNLNLNAL